MRFSKIFQPPPEAPKRDKRIQLVRNAEQLLEKPERVELINEIRDLAGAPPHAYQTLYADLINRFAEFVQLLPAYSHPAHKWLDHHLRLAKTALKMREQFLLVGETLHPMVSEQEALWHYVVFSSALLRKMGLLFTHYSVSLCEEQGQHVATWQPFNGPMAEQGNYYKLQNLSTADKPELDSISQLLARQIMPQAGFAWIASNPDALMAWLGIVNGERGGGVVHRIVALSEKQLYELAKRETLLNQLFRAESLEALLKATELTEQQLLALLPSLHGVKDPKYKLAPELFDWLEAQKNNDRMEIAYEEALLSGAPEKHYLISPQTISYFATANPKTIGNWFNIYRKALGYGLTVLAPHDAMVAASLSHAQQMGAQKTAPQSGVAQTTTAPAQTLFHQTFHDKAAPNATPTNPAQAAQIHQQNVQHTMEALNSRQGLMLGTMYGAANYLSGTNRAVGQQQQNTVHTQDLLKKDTLVTKAETQGQELHLKQMQVLEQRQREVRQRLDTQYQQQHQESSKRSSFSYTTQTRF